MSLTQTLVKLAKARYNLKDFTFYSDNNALRKNGPNSDYSVTFPDAILNDEGIDPWINALEKNYFAYTYKDPNVAACAFLKGLSNDKKVEGDQLFEKLLKLDNSWIIPNYGVGDYCHPDDSKDRFDVLNFVNKARNQYDKALRKNPLVTPKEYFGDSQELSNKLLKAYADTDACTAGDFMGNGGPSYGPDKRLLSDAYVGPSQFYARPDQTWFERWFKRRRDPRLMEILNKLNVYNKDVLSDKNKKLWNKQKTIDSSINVPRDITQKDFTELVSSLLENK